MKKIITLACLVLFSVVAFAQTPTQRQCGTLLHDQYLRQNRPNYVAERLQYEQMIQEYITKKTIEKSNPVGRMFNANSLTSLPTVTIPVVVHVVYSNASQSITPAQAAQQVQVLNDDFAKLNSDASNVPAAFASVASGANIRFCLAQRTPSNTATTGIIYKATGVTQFGTNDAVKDNAQGGSDPWDVTKYVNIWICDLTGSLLGYGEFPTGSVSPTWGLVCDYGSVPGGVTFGYNLGRTGTHEFGHCFNLFHIWGDDSGACSGSDQCSDTPNQADESAGCNSVGQVVTDACSPSAPGIQWMNYMDYSADACMYMFSTQQVSRMEAVVNNAPWNILASSNGCTPISTASVSLDASISAIISPVNGGVYCANTLTPQVVLKNNGSSTLTSAKVLYKMDATATQTLNWTGSLASAATATLSLNVYSSLTASAHTFSCWVNAPNGGVDAVTSNDLSMVSFTIGAALPLPLKEGFEATTFPPSGWVSAISNTINVASTWTRVANSTGIPVSPLSTACARMDNYSSSIDISGQFNQLLSPPVDFSSAGANTYLSFDVSHKQYDYTTRDSLIVLATGDCGQTWYQLYAKGDGTTAATTSGSLATVSGTGTAAFVPTANNQWRRDSVSMSFFAGSPKVYVLFASKSGWGNYLYLDNINLHNNTVATAPPTASIASIPSVCMGIPVTLNGSGTNSPTSWTWALPGGSPSTSTSQNPSVTFSSAGTYTVSLIATNGIGSSSPVNQVITVGSAPSISATSTISCGGSPASVSASGAATYSWSNGSSGSSINVNPTTTTTYTVYGSNGPGCAGIAIATVSVNPSPALVANSATICAGATATLNVSGATTYTWNTGANGASFTDNPTVTTPYTVGGSSTAGCTSYVTTYIVIATSPVISVNTPTICAGGSAVLSASGVTSYTWSTGSNAPSISVTPSVTTNYTINGSLTGCASNAVQTATVKVNPLPNVTFAPVAPLCVSNAPVTLGGSPINGTYTGTGTSGNMFNPAISGTGTYPVNYYYTDLNGCSNVAMQTVSVSACTGIIELTNSAISIYPNPAMDAFYVNFNNTLADNTVIELYDAIGKIILRQKVVNGIETISLLNLAKGIYSVRIVTNETQINTRIIKE